MGEKEDREKAEKLAAAKKRVAQLQKKKKKDAAGGAAEKSNTASATKAKSKDKQDKDQEKEQEDTPGDDNEEQIETNEEHETSRKEIVEESEGKAAIPSHQPDVQTKEELDHGDTDADEAIFNNAIKAATAGSAGDAEEQGQDRLPEASPDNENSPSGRKHNARQPSVSLQSKIRSTSFRQSAAPLSPSATAEADESVYRKQTLRIEELENENKALAEFEAKWRKSEEELEELREKLVEESGNGRDDIISKLQEEISSLRRSSRASVSAGADKARQTSTSGSGTNKDGEDMKKELESKEFTISDLQLEVSRLRSQISAHDEGRENNDEQITALQASLTRAQASVGRLEGELADTKKALTRASEKAVIDGTERTSKDTKIRALERENDEAKTEKEEMSKRLESFEKKIEAMNKLHREAEQRTSTKLSTAEAQARESQALKAKVDTLEKETARLREARKSTMSGDGGDDGLEELEDEERVRLEKRVRELEGEVFDLRRGVWRGKRKELQPGMAEDGYDGDDFDDVDLSGSGAMSRRRSTVSQNQGFARQHSGFTQVISSGLAAFRSTTMSPDSQQTQQTRARNDSLLEDFDDDFDPEEFARAQREEEMKKMVEHVREVKRGLKKWVGWRLDLVDARRGGGGWGAGDVFDV